MGKMCFDFLVRIALPSRKSLIIPPKNHQEQINKQKLCQPNNNKIISDVHSDKSDFIKMSSRIYL